MKNKKIVLAGGSGFLGESLAKFLNQKGFEITILSRKHFVSEYARVVQWDSKTLGIWKECVDGAFALINLTGRTVDCRYNKKNVRDMYDSRILSTRILGEAVNLANIKPEIWINSSTATIYEHTYGRPHTEMNFKICSNADAKDEISVDLASKWEDEFNRVNSEFVRKIIIRTAIVFGNRPGSAYDILRKLVRFGLGGKMGHGKQMVSWVHISDFCESIYWMITNRSAEGIYNIAASNPISNKDMMKTLRDIHHVPFGLPATKFMLEVGAFLIQTETELIIKSRNVVSERLANEGFSFKFQNFKDAILSLENDKIY